jgi:hypothetical protein
VQGGDQLELPGFVSGRHAAVCGPRMRKIINSTYISLDGVIENPQN